MKKKLINLILCLSVFVLLLPQRISAIDTLENEVTVVNAKIIEEMLIDAGYGGTEFEMLQLYNNNQEPAYTLGISEIGYIVVENETLSIHEYGEGNPYKDANGLLLYSGPLNYFKVENNTITDLTTSEIVTEIPISLSIASAIKNDDISTQSVVESGVTKVSNYKNYLQRRAFGDNSNELCGAIAVQIVINYLELQSGNDFVHSTHQSELLSVDTSYSSSRYPKAAAMLSHLSSTCGIGSYVNINTLTSGFSNYVNITNIGNKNISATWTINPSITTIKNRIYGNRPVILLTQGHPRYKNHYLVAYGYKIDPEGNVEWLVHTGWYSNVVDDGVIRHSELFINNEYVDYAVYFNY